MKEPIMIIQDGLFKNSIDLKQMIKTEFFIQMLIQFR